MIAALLLATILTAAPGEARVVDGDSIKLRGEDIRISTIDAPELSRAKCDAEKRLGLVARARLAELLSSGPVVITVDAKRSRDRYGRLLAMVEAGGRDVGEVMMGEGIVRKWTGKRRPWCLTD